mmetsp:Transcript_91705/g.137318  ORF Transcript_91705/g.137318 Transcript_91705/m.137318 type:complete len:92 (+) Transcript_91705:1641-1916(+)
MKGRPEHLFAKTVIVCLTCTLFDKDGSAIHVGEEFLDGVAVFFVDDGWFGSDGADPMGAVGGDDAGAFLLGEEGFGPRGLPFALDFDDDDG